MGVVCFIIVVEVGVIYVYDLLDKFEVCYGCFGIYGVGLVLLEGENFMGDFCSSGFDNGNQDDFICDVGDLICLNINLINCGSDGFIIFFFWGYCILFVWDYLDVVVGVNLCLKLFWIYDVKGYVLDFGGNFKEGNKFIGLGFEVIYQNVYKVNVFYINYFGGDYNEISDCDFIVVLIFYLF